MGLSEACTTFFLLYTVLRGLCAAFWLTRSIASRAANIKHRRGLAIHATRPAAWPRFRVGLPTMLSTFCAAFFLTRRGGLFASAAYAAAICFRKLITLSRIRSWCVGQRIEPDEVGLELADVETAYLEAFRDCASYVDRVARGAPRSHDPSLRYCRRHGPGIADSPSQRSNTPVAAVG